MPNLQFERMQALANIELTSLDNLHSFETTLSSIVTTATELMPASMGASIILWDSLSEKFTLSATTVPDLTAKDFSRQTRNEGGITRWIVDHQKEMVIENVFEDPFRKDRIMNDYGVRAYIGQPLHHNEVSMGVLFIFDGQQKKYSEEDILFSSMLANRISIATANLKMINTIHQLANYDQLTQIYNRHMLFEIGAKEFSRHKRYGSPLSVSFLDIKAFKVFNDQFGHRIGDLVLRKVADCLKTNIREADSVFRFGGDEFVLIFPNTNQADASVIFNRCIECINSISAKASDIMPGISVSIGTVEANSNYKSFDELIFAANSEMYKVKRKS